MELESKNRMRKRDPKHDAQLLHVIGLKPTELVQRIGVGDHKHVDFIASEVLATLVRNRMSQSAGVVTAAVEELNRRIQVLAGIRMVGMKGREEVERRGDSALQDTIDYIWDHFFEEIVAVSNSEVRFAVYVRDRFDDFMRHLRTEKNSMDSVDAMDVIDSEGNVTPLIETIEDHRGESPEQALMRVQMNAAVLSALMALPKAQRNAFYFRAEFDYEWKKVAELIGCSVTTAQKHYELAMEKLKGAYE